MIYPQYLYYPTYYTCMSKGIGAKRKAEAINHLAIIQETLPMGYSIESQTFK